MKNEIKHISLALFFLATAGMAHAQYVPTHPKYVTYIDGGKKFYEYFPSWEPGKQLSEDENFFISRVKIKERFVNRASQVIPDNQYNNERKFSLCTPMGISDTYWQTLPRGVMDGDTFGMWSYLDYQDGWSQSWIRNVGAYSDICHKNGVQNSGGVVFFDSWGGDNTESSATVNLITEKNADGSFKYLEKFMQFLRYYGVDGVTFNPEGPVPNAAALQDFFIACHEWADAHGTKFHVCWYGTSLNNGSMNLGHALTANKANWFVKNGKDVCDVYFLNYDWHSYAQSSISIAESLRKGSTSNLFGGYDIQGNWLGRATWTTFKNNAMSICFWGNHTTDMIYQNSTELGSTDEAVQRNYMQKQEQVFSGGNRNPANTPAISNNHTSSSTAAMKKFHGISALMPARSALQELPFITRFSLGNGKEFRQEGQATFHSKWYNLASQDYLPTWRWWITDNDGNVPSNAVECDFTFDDSWYAGSCMRVKGATDSSIIRLFKTNFQVSASDNVNFIYKLASGADSHARLFWTFVGTENDLHFADLGKGAEGEWTEWLKTAGEIGMTGNVAILGIAYDNTPASYEMLVGELGIVPQVAYNPVQPTITKAQMLERAYNGVSYKLIWDCGKSDAAKADPSIPTYNEDVDTWYYEVYSQAEGGEPTLDAMTTSWAHYVVGAYADAETTNYRFGVRAVAPDGKTASEISWSDWQTVEPTFVEGVSVDRPVVKAGETFSVNYTDPLHPAAAKWRIVDPATGNDMVTPAKDATGIKGSIDKQGTYDVIISTTDDDGNSGSGTTTAAKPVLSASDVVEGETYYIYTEGRGGLTVNSTSATTICGTFESGVGQKVDNTNILQHFQFVKKGSNLYLYSVATKKYVSASSKGTLTTDAKDPILFTDAGNGTVRLYFNANFNINLGGSNQVTIDTWKTKDDGNSFIILPVSAGVAAEVVLPTVYRGLIQISPDETGALPVINDFTAEHTTLSESQPSTAVTFDVARLGEGKVSRGLKMEDAYQFRIPKEALPATQKTYSVGFWIKPDQFAHSKYGTNLINKRDTKLSWPNNNWGAFWVIVWPETKDGGGTVVLDDNVISYTMYQNENGNFNGNSNKHETPFVKCTTDRRLGSAESYSLTPGTWTHVMISYDGSKQRIFFNGKKVCECNASFTTYNESPIYIGGSNVYHAGITGTIDDVQVWHKALSEAEVVEAMKGYEGKTVPSELKAYYTFESYNGNNTFPNIGSGASTMTGAYVNLEGAAGENTTGTVEVTLKPNNEVLGNATLPGSLEVTTTATLDVPSLVFTGTTAGGTLSSLATSEAGIYDATLTLSNMWGSAVLTKAGYITVEAAAGIHNVEIVPADSRIFNLSGQRVNTPAKGVYIIGGKKIVR